MEKDDPKRHSKDSSNSGKRSDKGSANSATSNKSQREEDPKRHSNDSGKASDKGSANPATSKKSEKEDPKRYSIESGGSGKASDKGSANTTGSRKPEKDAKLQRNEENYDRENEKDATEPVENNVSKNAPLMRTAKVAPAPAADDTGGRKHIRDAQPSRVLDVSQFLPPEALHRVKLLKRPRRGKSRPKVENKDKPPRPIAAKVVYLKKPEEPHEEEEPPPPEPPSEGPQIVPEETVEVEEPKPLPKVIPLPSQPPPSDGPVQQHPLPLLSFVDDIDRLLKETNEDKEIENRLNNLMDAHRGEQLRKLKNAAKARIPNYKFGDMIKTLNKLGIPCPTNQDLTKLHGMHSRWDPDGTVIEYFSPMLRSFIPVNMRGRYRGCWPTDTCMKGLNISKVPPKRDALEGFVERGRHVNIQEKYDDMSEVAVDEAHLDYLIEMQAFQAETLPVPIFYDMLHLGMQVANESLRILVQDEGFPPNNQIFASQLQHAEQLRRKIQLYGALGLETLESKRRGLGEYVPHWLKSRDETIRDIMASKDSKRYENLQKKEGEVKERETMRRLQQQVESAIAPDPTPKKPTVVRQSDVGPPVAPRASAPKIGKGRAKTSKVQPAIGKK